MVSLAALCAFAVLVSPTQLAIREPDSRPDNLRALAELLGRQSRDGHSVLFLPANRRVFMTMYADAFAGLDQTRLHTPGRNALLVDDLRRPTSSGARDHDPGLGCVVAAAPLPVCQPGTYGQSRHAAQ